ncbi:MAG: hypothetical protein R3357_07530 [Burkholderiales bacterium]|nr:hypothetical protein [Burkholderiales bacterium]
MLSRLRRALLLACIACGALAASPARAFDPMLSFLFGMAREIMYEAYLNSRKPPAPNAEPLPAVYPGTMVEPRKLREMIDESFVYLSERRREEIFQALHDEIIKPENAAVRASMIAYFTEHALAVRMVMERLSKLSEGEMRELSAHFAARARALPAEDREQLRKVLQEGLLPVPPDLNQKLVLAIAEIPRAPVAEEAASAGEQADGGSRQPLAARAPSEALAATPPPAPAPAPVPAAW